MRLKATLMFPGCDRRIRPSASTSTGSAHEKRDRRQVRRARSRRFGTWKAAPVSSR